MYWFLLALWEPTANSAVVLIDEKLINNDGRGAWLLASISAAFALLPLAALFLVAEIDLGKINFLAVAAGAIYSLAIALYMQTLARTNAIRVIASFQLIPVISLGLEWWASGILPGLTGGVAATIVVLAAARLNWLSSDNHPPTLCWALMLGCAVCYALQAFMLKMSAGGTVPTLWRPETATIVFWQHLGVAGPAAVFFFLSRLQKENTGDLRSLLGWSTINELLALSANASLYLAGLLAPLALVWAVSSIQPAIYLLMALILWAHKREYESPIDAHSGILMIVISIGAVALALS